MRTSTHPGNPTIYHVEDDFDLGNALAEIFRLHGAQVWWFRSGTEFFESYTPTKNSCIVLDLIMPNLSGLEILSMLRERGDRTPVIIFSAHSDCSMVVQAMKLGAFDFLVKGERVERLWESVISAVAFRSENTVNGDLENKTLKLGKSGDESRVLCDSPSSKLASVLTRVGRGYCHDLMNLLTTICTISDLLLYETETVSPNTTLLSESLRSSVMRVTEVANEMSDTLRGLQQFFRDVGSVEESQTSAVAGNEVRSYLNGLLGRLTQESGVELRLKVAGLQKRHSLPAVLLWILTKPLVENAVEAHASMTPGASNPQVTVTVKSLSKSRGIQVTVADNGPGWGTPPDQVMNAIREGHQRSTKSPSRGFSLNNTYSIVSALSGSVSIGGSEGAGASIEIRVPWRICHEET